MQPSKPMSRRPSIQRWYQQQLPHRLTLILSPHTKRVKKPLVRLPNHKGEVLAAATRIVALPQTMPTEAQGLVEVQPEGVLPEEEGAHTKRAPDINNPNDRQEIATDLRAVTNHEHVVSRPRLDLMNVLAVASQATSVRHVGHLPKNATTAAIQATFLQPAANRSKTVQRPPRTPLISKAPFEAL